MLNSLRWKSRVWITAAAVAGEIATLLPSTRCPAAQQDGSAITCTNPANGASWQVRIDYRNATVDANPAAITDGAITWFDPKDGGNYTLDRHSGQLTATVASSTGGYFRYAHCNLGNMR